jgi:hypothetical protein
MQDAQKLSVIVFAYHSTAQKIESNCEQLTWEQKMQSYVMHLIISFYNYLTVLEVEAASQCNL